VIIVAVFNQGPLEPALKCQFEHFALQLLRALVTSFPLED
jgi:hypothetical protein